jgi:uncharacterized protein YdeI (YjbR/CyaY-like superfamily)
MNKEMKDGFPIVKASDRKRWREWLEKNHDDVNSVWLLIFKKDTGIPTVTYAEAVEEALCFGWIDSKPNKNDEKSYYQFFSKRNPKSNWSAKNKATIEQLIASGKLAEPGLEMVRMAKASGKWDALNDVENLVVPPDLQIAFNKRPGAFTNWQQFPPSVQRGILEWIFNAKRPGTRMARIEETAEKAAKNIRANQYRS